MQKPVMTDITQSIIVDVENGSMLSPALDQCPSFDTLLDVALISTGESSGLLDKVLMRMAENLEKQEKLKQTIRGAMTYPVIVVIMMIVVITIMMIFVIPQLSTLYGNLNIDLPFTTIIVVALSNFTV